MTPLDVLWALAQAPWWLGWALLAGGVLGLGIWIGAQL